MYARVSKTLRMQLLFRQRWEESFEEVGVEFAGREVGVGEDALVQRERGLDALDDEHLQGPAHAGDGFGAVASANDELGDQRIVVGRDDGIGMSGGVHAHAGAAGNLECGDAAGRRDEGLGVFGIDAALDGVAAEVHRSGGVFEFLARGDADLGLDQVHVGDHLGDRMLDLNTRVHFDEVERAVIVHKEFDGAGVGVADFLQRLDDLAAEFRAALGIESGRGRLLDELLVAALDAAFALAQMHHVAVAIAEHLKFDVARTLDELFEVDVGNAERLLRLVARRLP